MKPYVLVIGHACAAGEAPANTLAGVRACLDCRAEGMEIDVQLSADGVPVLMHDDTVDRTTNLTGPVMMAAEMRGSVARARCTISALKEWIAVQDSAL